MASSSYETKELSSTAKESSSPRDFKKSRSRLLSSSENNSSPDSPLDDPFGEEEEETLLRFGQGSRISVGGDDDAQINNGDFPKHVAESSHGTRDESPSGNYKLPETGDLNSDGNSVHLALESPPNQVMERNNTATTTSAYRIPSHVFKRSKSNTPVEWSLTSNESLFSIQIGNMSFTKEQFLLRLDEVATPPAEPPPSSSGNPKFSSSGPLPLPPPQARASSGSKSVDATHCRGLGVGEGTEEILPKHSTVVDDVKVNPAETDLSPKPFHSHRSVESEGGKAIRGRINKEPTSETPKKDFSPREINSDAVEKRFSGAHISRMSAESNNSTKSFAFPILEGADKNTSISMSSGPILGRDQFRIHSQPVNTSKKQEVVTDQRQISETSNSSPKAEAEAAAASQPKKGSGWFSCLSSWSCCR